MLTEKGITCNALHTIALSLEDFSGVIKRIRNYTKIEYIIQILERNCIDHKESTWTDV